MILEESREKLAAIFADNGAPDIGLDWIPCDDARHGDYQCNAAMPLAKKLSRNPRELAAAVATTWNRECAARWGAVKVAGPGFLNWRLSDSALRQDHLRRAQSPGTLSPLPAEARRTFVLDYSSPNVAKAMHVGHIRSTILGDALARALRLRGHRVITDNHIGDWGTQFGKLIYGWKKFGNHTAFDSYPLAEMERLYKTAHELSERDPAVLEECRRELLLLQKGDPENRALWELFRARSQDAFDHIYRILDIRFDHTLGESFYQDRLGAVVSELRERGIARESDGAICVFFPGHRELGDKPFLIEKSDGAALYATTDLATLQYRMETFSPDEIWYVTDMRQSLHFAQLFETARLWGIPARLRHVAFGAILGPDRRPLKTREGAPVRLDALLDEAVARARALMQTRGQAREPDTEIDPEATARALGIGAVKYADLSQNRHLDYVFDWDKMLAFDGNTAPYLINAHVRARSILRKAQDCGDPASAPDAPIEPAERETLLLLTRWEAVVDQVIAEQRPHHLCFYLYALAGAFHRFFENCPVLKSAGPLRQRRLALCHTVARVLADGLRMLGITPLERM
jgi:arginyl-tRNA synthetase